MSNNEADNSLVSKIRKMLEDDQFSIEILAKFVFIHDFVTLLEACISQKWGELKKVTIFGGYIDNGEEVSREIAYTISQKGYLAITGKGFYLPNDANEFHQLIELFPEILTWIFEADKAQVLLYRYILPAISDYSIDKLYPNRTNAYELEGCSEYNVPTLGFIVDERIKEETPECKLSNVTISNQGIGKECSGEKSSDCENARAGKVHCAFYHITDIPLVQKIWFFTSKDWRLIAMEDIEMLNDYLDTFLPNITAN
jgi:hypothetical protein